MKIFSLFVIISESLKWIILKIFILNKLHIFSFPLFTKILKLIVNLVPITAEAVFSLKKII